MSNTTKVDNELRKYGISGPEQRGIRALGEALEKVLGETYFPYGSSNLDELRERKREAYTVRLSLQTELRELGYQITKIPKPRANRKS